MSDAEILAAAQKQGPCFFCDDGALARHRLWDSIDADVSRKTRRVSLAWICDNYGVSADEVLWVRREYRKAREAHGPLPGRPGWRGVA